MDADVSPAVFDLTGTFEGFVFTASGKRRMALRIDGANSLFKVPRLLRRRVIGNFRSGQILRVIGVEERNEEAAPKRIVERILPEGSDALAIAESVHTTCTIKVCAKKNCWRNGGRELLSALKQESESLGLTNRVELKAVGCLDRCKQAPNADSPWREYRRCTPQDARAILKEVARRFGEPSPES